MSIIAQEQPSRQGYVSAVQFVAPGAAPSRSGEVNPSWLKLAGIFGVKAAEDGGFWLNCRFEYRKPAGQFYQLEAAVWFSSGAQPVGRCFVRSCECPDHARRVAAGAQGAARLCKHMIALQARLSEPFTGGGLVVPGLVQKREVGRQRLSRASQQAQGWKEGRWSPATGWEEEAA